MERRPIIMVDTSNMPMFCRNHCCNGDCSKHISKGMAYTGACKFSLLKDTGDCEGYISRRQQALQNKQGNSNVTDSDTKTEEREVKDNGRI